MAGNVRKNKKKKAPVIGELINPIVLAKKETNPTGDTAFEKKLKVFRAANAKIVERNRETSDPDLDFNEDNTHEFIIRTYIGEKIEDNTDVIIHDGFIYDIQYVTRVIDGIAYVKLVCTLDKPVSDLDYEEEVITPEVSSDDDEDQFPGFGEFT